MKKWLTGILTVAVVLSIGTTSVFAAGCGRDHVSGNKGGICGPAYTECLFTDRYSREFVDDNSDGICDNYTTDCHHQSRTEHGCKKGQGNRHTRF